jgi:hypothetical protein
MRKRYPLSSRGEVGTDLPSSFIGDLGNLERKPGFPFSWESPFRLTLYNEPPGKLVSHYFSNNSFPSNRIPLFVASHHDARNFYPRYQRPALNSKRNSRLVASRFPKDSRTAAQTIFAQCSCPASHRFRLGF